MDENIVKQLSGILENNNIDLNQILEKLDIPNNQDKSHDNSPDSNNFDPETLLKIQNLLKIINNKEKSSDENLLMALKPYMRDSRKDKIDKYIKILHAMKLFENFQEMGGNLNDFL